MSVISMKQLLEAGVHFGHRTRRWNPKMRPFIFTERSGIHIIDLQQTLLQIEKIYEEFRNTAAKGGMVLFVGTKRQAQAVVREEAERCGMPYVNIRWLGGTMTNWATIKQRIDYLLKLERRWDAGEFRNLTKKEQLDITREIEKLNRRLGGLKIMEKMPEYIFIVDVHMEALAVSEASKLKVPIVGMVDTNSDPDPVAHVIPCNDDAIRSVKLIVSVMANAIEEGRRLREVDLADTGQVSASDLKGMEQYLGPSTIARLRDTEEGASNAEEQGSATGAEATGAEQDGSSNDRNDTSVSEVSNSEVAASEAPVSEAPVSEAPVSEAPVSEAPVSEAPVSEAPVSEAPVSETMSSDSSASDTSASDTDSAGGDGDTVSNGGDSGAVADNKDGDNVPA